MIKIEELKNIATELIVESYSEFEMIQKVEKLRMAMVSGSESHKQFGNIKLRLNRLLTSQSKGTESAEYYDKQINSIQQAIFEFIGNIDSQEIHTSFEYNIRRGLIYHICNFEGELRYKFIGNLHQNKPEGEGTAIYPSGDYFEGLFKNGLKEGIGRLHDRSGRLIKEGKWKNDRFIEKNAIEYYPDLSVAASIIRGMNTMSESIFETMIIPTLRISGLVAFPVVGDSMIPTFAEDDIVICKPIINMRDYENNKPYVILYDNNLMLKIIQKIPSKDDDQQELRLVSENYMKYPSFDIEVDNSTKFYKVISQIKKH